MTRRLDWGALGIVASGSLVIALLGAAAGHQGWSMLLSAVWGALCPWRILRNA